MVERQNYKVGVIGAGSWGTALAILFARNGHDVFLWARDKDQAEKMSLEARNSRYLPDVVFPNTLHATSDLETVVTRSELLVLVIPSSAFRHVANQIGKYIRPQTDVLLATKGFEKDSFKLMHEVCIEELGKDRNVAVVSGPTFAKEVAKGLPTAITVACDNDEFANKVADIMHNETFRAYTSNDLIGVEVGGAVKNVLAIAAGIADGLEFGANTRAALITRGLVEIQRLGVALGADPRTFMGLAGLGDLVLTCTDDQSRNRRVGISLAAGESLEQIQLKLGQVAEGVYAAKEAHQLAKQLKVEMPIVEHVYRIIYKKEDPLAAVHALLGRSIKSE
ncbi:MAG: NAD(P)-dependent glycerol-3-phosphate dehydrogenase [Gammaproteobacteria bacterium]|nr:NAD(P)-dependent glycerol-3-phosphate dehydrogenase [Gammaproteobacteria bacterium]